MHVRFHKPISLSQKSTIRTLEDLTMRKESKLEDKIRRCAEDLDQSLVEIKRLSCHPEKRSQEEVVDEKSDSATTIA